MSFDAVAHVASELKLPAAGVRAVAALLDDKCTVPFIARYRKEQTGGLDEVQIRAIEERRTYLVELQERRESVLESIREQGKLTPALEAAIGACTQKTALEDLYLPFKQKRRTRAQIAIEKGLLPLAERILAQTRDGDPRREAAAFGDVDVEEALKGARDIVAERMAEETEIRTRTREVVLDSGQLSVTVVKAKANERTKFEQYYGHEERLRDMPSHRYLAICRGENEDVLKVKLVVDDERLLARIGEKMRVDARSPWSRQLIEAIEDGYHRLLIPSITSDVRGQLKDRSDVGAAAVFAENLSSLLLQAPFGARAVVGIDPGIRTGCKTVFIDANGAFVENITLHLSQGERSLEQSAKELVAFVKKHKPAAIAIGNGTFSRETEGFVRKALKAVEPPLTDVVVVSVNEAGASVYSASEIARTEHPELDVTVRGAISIARRLQDPLAELVKIDPQSIGVGQYQHDVHQPLLSKKLDDVVESCVNQVGVELNTASPSLLSRVAGIGPGLAQKIVKHREKKGAFTSRNALMDVSGLGPRAFEQCAGFLRVRGGAHPLDASAVHPERYALVKKMAEDLDVPLASLVGDAAAAARIPIARYVDAGVGLPTLEDIVGELRKPGRDPRATFEPPKFREDVNTMEDLTIGMQLQGIVTNVTAFGAFVDVGVHQDGLVHVSQLSDQFVKNPADVVKAGDRISVRVLEIDLVRKRIALTAKSGAVAKPTAAPAPPAPRPGVARPEPKFTNNPFAALKKPQ